MESGSFVTITAVGVAQASVLASSAAISIPTMSSGELPRFVRVSATVAACIGFGKTSITATTGHAMIQPGEPTIFCVQGYDKFAVIRVAADGVVQVSPLENM